ncbi:MAG: methylated-DNA--[protein]-cysteine S-methyltransferase [Bacteroidales bacterium]|nr:methylated-DNA--[protein]-cysteine S-methyltransferase [Bacteroidales bacterium]
MAISSIHSPLGFIQISASELGINSLFFLENDPENNDENKVLKNCIDQLKAYFRGELKNFDLPLDLQGTEFQKTVWKELLKIPYGKTISYMELAKKLGDPKSIRAAAHTNGQNPVSIIVPCHRVIGSDGSLTGYAGGLWRKQWLLEHESKQPPLF